MDRGSTDAIPYIMSAPPMATNGTYSRLPGQANWRPVTLPWPRTEWDVARGDSPSSRHGNVLVGDGPAFVTLRPATCTSANLAKWRGRDDVREVAHRLAV